MNDGTSESSDEVAISYRTDEAYMTIPFVTPPSEYETPDRRPHCKPKLVLPTPSLVVQAPAAMTQPRRLMLRTPLTSASLLMQDSKPLLTPFFIPSLRKQTTESMPHNPFGDSLSTTMKTPGLTMQAPPLMMASSGHQVQTPPPPSMAGTYSAKKKDTSQKFLRKYGAVGKSDQLVEDFRRVTEANANRSLIGTFVNRLCDDWSYIVGKVVEYDEDKKLFKIKYGDNNIEDEEVTKSELFLMAVEREDENIV